MYILHTTKNLATLLEAKKLFIDSLYAWHIFGDCFRMWTPRSVKKGTFELLRPRATRGHALPQETAFTCYVDTKTSLLLVQTMLRISLPTYVSVYCRHLYIKVALCQDLLKQWHQRKATCFASALDR
jgi:hypothetical protein